MRCQAGAQFTGGTVVFDCPARAAVELFGRSGEHLGVYCPVHGDEKVAAWSFADVTARPLDEARR